MYLTLLVLFLICAIIRYVSQVRNSRIYEVVFQYPPCFRELPLLGSLYHFWSYKNSSEDTLKKIVEMGSNTIKAGGITRLYGPNMFYLVLTDASDIAEVLASYLNKDGIYNVIKVLTGNGSIFVSEHSISKVRRRAILPLLQPKFLTRYIEWTWAESVALTEVLAPFVGKGPFAAGHYLGAFCFNSIIRWGDVLEMRKELCTLKLSEDLQRAFRLIYERTSSLWMIPDFVYKHTANHSETHKIAMSFRDVAGKAIQMQKDKSSRIPTPISSDDFNENYKNNCALFDCLLRSHLTQEEIIEEIIVIMGASEEASLAIGFALTLLGQYPAVQDRLYEELVNIVGESDRPLEKEDVAEMPYLDSFVKEVLRLYQTVPLILRQAHKEIKLSSGRVIPEGAGIVVPMISLHRNPAYWGPDADHFDPERFLPERLAAIPDDAYIPFSSGQRSCPGYKLASYLVKLALCAILRRYKVVGTPAAGPVPHIRTKFEVVLRPVNNFEIELVNRI